MKIISKVIVILPHLITVTTTIQILQYFSLHVVAFNGAKMSTHMKHCYSYIFSSWLIKTDQGLMTLFSLYTLSFKRILQTNLAKSFSNTASLSLLDQSILILILSGIQPVNACISMLWKWHFNILSTGLCGTSSIFLLQLKKFTEFEPGKSYPPITFI